MKAATTALQNFLEGAQNVVFSDLYTITLSSGVVLRYSGCGMVVSFGGTTWPTGPRFVSGSLKQTTGVASATMEVNLYADSRHTIAGIPILTYIKNKGFDSADILIERIYAAAWNSAWVGKHIRFSGRLSEVQDAGVTALKMIVASGTEVLDVDMPCDPYQNSCLNTLFDHDCALDVISYSAHVTGSPTINSFASNIETVYAFPAGYFNLGTVTFTSGVNSGQKRTVKTQDGSGNIVLAAPLLGAPASSDTFTMTPGCDLSQVTCSIKFENLIHFRGQPYIPVPETIMGGTGSAVTNPTVSQAAGINGGNIGGGSSLQ